jgi:anaerobic magnesium-protoporphyrin IX monomethyl ester cyclase
MKIILIRPDNQGNINTRLPESLNRRQGVLPPLGIAYIAAALEKAGHRVRILDVIAAGLTAEQLRRQINDFQPDLAGITIMTSTLFGGLEAAKIAKEEGAITVLGGPQLSVYPQETLTYPYVDYGISGEGEIALPLLAAALENNVSVDNLEGLVYRKDGQVRVNPPADVADIDALTPPAYHLLPMDRYDSIIGDYPVSTMISSRGCPYQCHFCFKQPSDSRCRFRSPKLVVDEMQYLAGHYAVKEIMFYDDVITSRRQHIAGICEEILSRNLQIKWEAPSRVDNVDGGLLDLMRRAGCIRLRYGVESADEETLKLMNKKTNLTQVKEIFRLTKKSGIQTFAYFMLGYAHETASSIKQTINFALELNPDWVMFTMVTPYPGTPLYAIAQQEGLLQNDYWREFTLGRQKERIPYFVPEVAAWTKKAYRKFYFRPGFLWKQLARMRSRKDWRKCLRGIEGILTMAEN